MIREFKRDLFVVIVVVTVRTNLVITSIPVDVSHCACAAGLIIFSAVIASYGEDNDSSDDTDAQDHPTNRQQHRPGIGLFRFFICLLLKMDRIACVCAVRFFVVLGIRLLFCRCIIITRSLVAVVGFIADMLLGLMFPLLALYTFAFIDFVWFFRALELGGVVVSFVADRKEIVFAGLKLIIARAAVGSLVRYNGLSEILDRRRNTGSRLSVGTTARTGLRCTIGRGQALPGKNHILSLFRAVQTPFWHNQSNIFS